MFSFIATPLEQLIQNILWYVENGRDSITFELIHADPVRTVNGAGEEAFNTDAVVEEEDYEQEEESNQEETAVDLPAAEVNEFVPAVVAAMFERKVLQESLTFSMDNHGAPIDPTTRRVVREVQSFASTVPSELNLADPLQKLTWFIKTHLLALQHYVETGNLPELRVWFAAWQCATEQYRENSLTEPERFQQSILDCFEDINIKLPNHKTIARHAVDSAHKADLMPFLRDHYGIVHKPTDYEVFMQFLLQVRDIDPTDWAQIDHITCELLRERMSGEIGRVFFSTALLNEGNADWSVDLLAHLNMYPLQLACLERNVNAVGALIRHRATLRVFQDQDPEEDPQINLWRTAEDAQKPEIIIAIDSGNKELFKALKPLYIPGEFWFLLNLVVPYVLSADKPEFLQLIELEYCCELNPIRILREAMRFKAPGCVRYFLSRHLSVYAQMALYTYSEEQKHLFHAISDISDIDQITDVADIIIQLLPLFPPEFYNFDFSRSQTLPVVAQTAIMIAHEVVSLCDKVLIKRREFYAQGRVTGSFNDEDAFIEQKVYRAMYAHYELFKQIKAMRRIDQLVDLLASVDRVRGEFMPDKIVMLAQRVLDSAQFSVPAGSTLQQYGTERDKHARLMP